MCVLLIVTAIATAESLNSRQLTSINVAPSQGGARDSWTEEQKIHASDGSTDDRFGFSVTLDGNTALIGAPIDDSSRGTVYVFTRTDNTWTQQAKLSAEDGDAGDCFGHAVSLDGDTALIGAYMDDDNGFQSGSAYVFIRNGATWTQQAKLLGLGLLERFGSSVSLSGDTALIGAPTYNNVSGSAYVFTRTGTTWTQQQKLVGGDSAYGDGFAYAVALDGDTAVIGSPYDDDNGLNSGSVYVFTRTGTNWTQQVKLNALDGKILNEFGCSIFLDGDTALIGASGAGAAYVFFWTGTHWVQRAKVTAEGDEFGCSVSLDGDTALIGAMGVPPPPPPTIPGWAYVFVRYEDNYSKFWWQQAKLLASDGTEEDYFGCSVSIDGNTALIGAYGDEDNGDESGSAYVFNRELENDPPFPPHIYGETHGKTGTAYPYRFTTWDPEKDKVSYYIDWGDGTTTNWTEFQPSGYPGYTENHTWNVQDTYTIRAKTKDSFGAESGWTTLSVTMPCPINTPFMQFWEILLGRFPYAFPILRHLLGG